MDVTADKQQLNLNVSDHMAVPRDCDEVTYSITRLISSTLRSLNAAAFFEMLSINSLKKAGCENRYQTFHGLIVENAHQYDPLKFGGVPSRYLVWPGNPLLCLLCSLLALFAP